MRDIKVLRVYNLVDIKGNKLQLRLGILKSRAGEVCITDKDTGYRWCFNGKEIPMPVRSGYWFNGFEESIMLGWLKRNGWYPHSRVDMGSEKVTVYELFKGNEPGNLAALASVDRSAFDRVIRDLVGQGNRATACRLYRYVHGGTLRNANDAVNIIVTE